MLDNLYWEHPYCLNVLCWEYPYRLNSLHWIIPDWLNIVHKDIFTDRIFCAGTSLLGPIGHTRLQRILGFLHENNGPARSHPRGTNQRGAHAGRGQVIIVIRPLSCGWLKMNDRRAE